MPVSPDAPLYDSGFPLVGPADLDPALCSLSSVGGDIASLVSRPEDVSHAAPLADECRAAASSGRAVGTLVDATSAAGEVPPIRGYLHRVPAARGLVVLFAGLAMPPDGWINRRFAEWAASRGYASFALVRDETPVPMRFDPRMEARRGILAAQQIRGLCGVAKDGPVGFVGISMGGIEALLAARDAPSVAPSLAGSRAIVLDPVLEPAAVARNLDKYWRSISVDAMQNFFRRIVIARYGEPSDITFTELLGRTKPSGPTPTLTDPDIDAPARWLCRERVPATIFLSTTDPALGDEQRATIACENPSVVRRNTTVPGHIPLGCELDLFRQMVEALP